MDFIERLPIPKHLSARVWLVSLPSALVSFERRQGVPKLPRAVRFLGVPLIAFGVALALWSWRNPGKSIRYNGPASQLSRKPATAGGILALAGVAIFMRSLVLAAYSVAIAFAATTERIAIDDPKPDWLLGRNRD